jgi:hypothetical protein
MDLERGAAEMVGQEPPHEQTPLLPTTDAEANPEEETPNAPEAIPASSVQRSAMNGFAGLGCT